MSRTLPSPQEVLASGWNPRFFAYAAAHGRSPEEMREKDMASSMKMASFTLWNGARWDEFRKEIGIRRDDEYHGRRECQDRYDAWLFKGVAEGRWEP